ncbi:MAG: hypothetical protein QOE93_775 [Actinomycetota bacterium]|nr:hypothetical protein [Actinomycetota bacterium]
MVVAGVAAVAGIGLGHVLEYAALVPDSHHRRAVLTESGHHYLPTVLVLVSYLAVLAVTVRFLTGVRRGIVGRHAPPAPAAGDWARVLPLAQAVAFVALEIGERLVAHAPLADLGRVLLLGLPLQVVVGLVVASVLAALARTGEQLGRAVADRLAHSGRRPRRRPDGIWWRPVIVTVSPPSHASGTAPARGPPSPLVVAA